MYHTCEITYVLTFTAFNNPFWRYAVFDLLHLFDHQGTPKRAK